MQKKMQILCFLAYPISYEVMKDVVCIIAKTKTSEFVRKCIACLCYKGVLFLLILLSMTCKCMRYCCRCSLIVLYGCRRFTKIRTCIYNTIKSVFKALFQTFRARVSKLNYPDRLQHNYDAMRSATTKTFLFNHQFYHLTTTMCCKQGSKYD